MKKDKEIITEKENLKALLGHLNKLRLINKGKEVFNPAEFLDIDYISNELSKAFDAMYEVDLYLQVMFDIDEININHIMNCTCECDEIRDNKNSFFFNQMLEEIKPDASKMKHSITRQISDSIDYLRFLQNER